MGARVNRGNGQPVAIDIRVVAQKIGDGDPHEAAFSQREADVASARPPSGVSA